MPERWLMPARLTTVDGNVAEVIDDLVVEALAVSGQRRFDRAAPEPERQPRNQSSFPA